MYTHIFIYIFIICAVELILLCVCVCTPVCMYVCICVCWRVCIQIRKNTCLSKCDSRARARALSPSLSLRIRLIPPHHTLTYAPSPSNTPRYSKRMSQPHHMRRAARETTARLDAYMELSFGFVLYAHLMRPRELAVFFCIIARKWLLNYNIFFSYVTWLPIHDVNNQNILTCAHVMWPRELAVSLRITVSDSSSMKRFIAKRLPVSLKSISTQRDLYM